MKLIWTVAWLCAWTGPAGTKAALVVVLGARIRVFLGDEAHHATLVLPPRWRPWRYHALLDESARLLCEDTARLRRRMDAAHDEFCKGLNGREGKGKS